MRLIQSIVNRLLSFHREQKLLFVDPASRKPIAHIQAFAQRLWIMGDIRYMAIKYKPTNVPTHISVVSQSGELTKDCNFSVHETEDNDWVVLESSFEWPTDFQEEISVFAHFESSKAASTLVKWQYVSASRLSIENQYAITRHLPELAESPDSTPWLRKLLFSIIIPVYNPNLLYLRDCIESAINQKGPVDFEIILTVDEIDSEGKNYLSNIAKVHAFIHVHFNAEVRHISENLNQGLKLASGDYCCFLDQDDFIERNALHTIQHWINEDALPDIIYSDEDKTLSNGKPHRPIYKPDFDPYLLKSVNYVNHFLIVKRAFGNQLGWFRKGFEGAQDYDFLIRALAYEPTVVHVSKILYHWRMTPKSTATAFSNKSYAGKAMKQALMEHFNRIEKDVRLEEGKFPGMLNYYPNVEIYPDVVIFCFDSDDAKFDRMRSKELMKGGYPGQIKVVLVVDESKVSAFRKLESNFDNFFIEPVSAETTFSTNQLFRLSKKYKSPVYGVLLKNSEFVESDFLEKAIGYFNDSNVDIVSSMGVDPSGNLLHAGLIPSMQKPLGLAFMKGMSMDHPGYFRKDAVRQVTLASINGMFIRSNLLSELDDMKIPERPTVAHVDLCLGARKLGRSVLFNPHCSVRVRREDTDNLDDSDMRDQSVRSQWGETLNRSDLWFNANLSCTSERPLLRRFQTNV